MYETKKTKGLRRKIANAEARVLKMSVLKGRFIMQRCKRIDELKKQLSEEANQPYAKEF